MKPEYRIQVEDFMHWETRIITQTYSMKEVVLDSKGKIMYAHDLGRIIGMSSKNSLNGLKEEVSKFNKAFKKPFIFFDHKTGKWKEQNKKSNK